MPLPTDETAHLCESTESKDEQELLRVFIESSPDAALVVSRLGKLVLANAEAERLFGYTRDELIGRAVEVLLPERFHATHPGQVAEFFRDPHPIAIGLRRDLHARHKDGREIPVEIGLSPLDLDQGLVVLAMVRDISVRVRAEERMLLVHEELERSNLQLREFAHAAAHDLQEPLRSIAVFCQLLERKLADQLDAESREWLRVVVGGAERMKTLVHGLLALSGVEAKSRPLEPTSVEAVLADVLANLRGSIEESSAEVTYDELPTVLGDYEQLVELFQNVIHNAIKFSNREPPRVNVSARQEGSDWVVCVRDNGIGIKPEYHDRIFQVFKRLHLGQEYPGKGMGLAVCRRIVQRHGGRIWVESEPGRGSAFHFTLPNAVPGRKT